jgi:hypothetical protein
MTKTLLLLSFCFIYISTFGQYSYYKKALIVKKDSTTYSGYVEKISESELNPVLKFKQNMDDDNSVLFHVDDVQQLVFTDDSLTFENVNYTWRKDSIKITEQRLAKKLIEGYACLYKLQLHPEEISTIVEVNNTFVYVLKIDSTYYSLDQKERLVYGEYKLIKNYQGVLYYVLKDYSDLTMEIKQLDFSDSQIVPLINKLNGYHSEVKSVMVNVKREKSWISHGPVVGAMGVKRMEGEYIGSNIGYQLKMVHPSLSEKLSTDFGAFYGSYTTDFLKDPTCDFVRFYLGVTYRFNNNIVSPFIGGGIAYHAYLKYQNEVMASGTLGVIFYKRTIVSATIEGMPGSIIPEIVPPTHLFFNLGFLFGKN